jgi:hypothetical protein
VRFTFEAGVSLAMAILLAGCAAPAPSSAQAPQIRFGEPPMMDPQIPPAPYGGGGANTPWSSPNSLPKGF